MKPEVLVIAPTQGSYGGIEITAISQVEQLERMVDTRLHLKLTQGYAFQDSLKTVLEESGIPYRVSQRGIPALWESIRSASIVHAHNVSPDVMITSLILSKPIYLTIHNRYHKNNWRHFIGRFLQHVSNYRVYNSSFVRNSWSSEQRTTSSVYPSVSRLPKVTPKPVRERHGFFFIGRWIENKGIDTLIEAYERANFDKEDHPLYLAGKGPLFESISKRIKSKKPAGIKILGFLTDEQKFEYYSKVRWNVAPPNTLEDMGLTPIEARHCKTPSVITRDGGLPEAAGSAAIISEPGSVDSLQAALEKAVKMPIKEYEQRAETVYEELDIYLKSMDVFLRRYPLSLPGSAVV